MFFLFGIHCFSISPPSNGRGGIANFPNIRASSCTSVAAGLWPAYDKKIVYRRIVLVTDEEENTACHGMRFAQRYRKYEDEVNPTVDLLLVGVGSGYDTF